MTALHQPPAMCGSNCRRLAAKRRLVLGEVPAAVTAAPRCLVPGPRGRAACEATKPASSTGAGTGADWSKRLLSVASNKIASNKPSPAADIFSPAKSGAAAAKRKSPGKKTPPGGGTEDAPDDEPVDSLDAEFDDDDEDEGAGGMGLAPERKRLPAEMRCFDTARIYIKGGDGGNGCVAFRREKFVEHGGPAGGTGGRGGNVWAVAEPGLNSLTTFRGQVHFRANNGVNGQGSNCDGADADDLLVTVPLGTIIRRRDADEDEPPLAELITPGQRALLAAGGRGGRGNFSFKTARDRAPTIAERGEKGEELWVDLELKVVADAGIIGVPNAGKSTLLSVLTAARPKIANYPFTTLVPNLGVCEMDYRTTVFADVPGLLEGAHEGLGLGHEFLRHVQRCRVLVHVLDGTSPDPVGDFRAINLELELFNPGLRDKPQIVAYNKVDLPDSGDFWELVREQLTTELGVPADRLFPISAATGQGVPQVVRAVRSVLDELGPAPVSYETNAVNATEVPTRSGPGIDEFEVSMEELPAAAAAGGAAAAAGGGGVQRVFYVAGEGIERFAQMTNWDYYEAARRFQRVLEASGINRALRARGVRPGDTVVIGDAEFNWSDDQSDAAVYDSWLRDMKDRGVNRQGTARWPSHGG